MSVIGEDASAELMDCSIRKNRHAGLVAEHQATVTLRGDTVSGNEGNGVVAYNKGRITVSTEQPTVCTGHESDWVVQEIGELEGVAQEKIYYAGGME